MPGSKTCLVKFLISSKMNISQPLWTICFNIWPLSKNFFEKKKKIIIPHKNILCLSSSHHIFPNTVQLYLFLYSLPLGSWRQQRDVYSDFSKLNTHSSLGLMGSTLNISGGPLLDSFQHVNVCLVLRKSELK